MDSLQGSAGQLSIVCLLVKMTCVPSAALECPRCDPGFFMVKNCTMTEGIQCNMCTDCSVNHQDTLTECSERADSVCVNRTHINVPGTTAATPVPTDQMWIILSVMCASVFLILVLALVLTLYSCRYKQIKGLYEP